MSKSSLPVSAKIIELPTVRARVDAITAVRVNPALASFLRTASKAA